jgi:biopolymer transport protein ExbD
MALKVKAAPVMAAPNVIPMADIMLVLLIIFMVIIPMLQQGQAVNMAKAVNVDKFPDAQKEDAVIIAVTRDSRYFLSPGNKQITLDDITGDVRDLLTDRQDKTVYVRADERAPYGDVVKAVDEIRSAGVENLGLLTEQIQSKTGQAVGTANSGSD